MLNRSNIQWSGKTLYNMVTKGKVNFDNYVQRHYVWDDSRKSLFIHSLLTGYPVPPFFAARTGDQYDMLDGLQRSMTTVDFIDNKFLLGLDEEYRRITLEDGTEFILEGRKYEELPEELQDRIRDFSFTVYYFDGITDDEVEEMFYRLNNGKPLSAIELTRVKAQSFDMIKELAAHPMFNVALTEKAKEKYNNEDMVIKSYIMLFSDKPSFNAKDMREIVRTTEIRAEQADRIETAFNNILAVYNSIQNSNAAIAKRMIRKTHLVSLVRLASTVDQNALRAFILGFFGSKGKAATVSNSYNMACQYGSGKPEAIARRLSEIRDYYDTHIRSVDDIGMSLDDLHDDESAVG